MSLLAQSAASTGGTATAEIVLFWVFAVVALGAAVAVITMRNIVHGALMLVINLLAIAGLFLTLQSSFLSIIQVLVYAGAIMVLFLFVIMLLGVSNDDLLLATSGRSRVAAVLAAALLAGAVVVAFVGPYTSAASVCGATGEVATSSRAVACVGLQEAYAPDDGSGVAFLGERLFTRYTYPFELSALLLTVATIGAVILARRRDLEPEDEDDPDPLDPDLLDDEPLDDADAGSTGARGSLAGQMATDAHGARPSGADDEREG